MKKENEILRILKDNTNYRKLLSTTTVTGLTTWGAFITMLILLGEITDSGLQLGILWSLSGLVPIFMSFILGGLVDRLDTKKVIVVTEFLKAPLYLLFIFVPLFEGWTAWILFFIIRFLLGILGSLTTVARQTIIPEIIEEKDLTVANSLNFTLTSAVRLLGAASGGVLVTLINLNFFWVLTSISFVYAGFTIMTLQVKNFKMKAKERSFLGEIKTGLMIAKDKVYVKYVLLFALTGGLIIGSFNLMIEHMVHTVYQIPSVGLSVLYVVEGLTSVLLGIWIANNKIFFKNIYRYGYIYILMGSSWALFGLTSTLWQGVLVMIVFAFVGGFVVPFERYVMQTHVASDLRGRVFGLWNTSSMLSMQLGALFTGIIIDYLGTRYVTLIVAVLEVLLGVVFLFKFKSKNELSKTEI